MVGATSSEDFLVSTIGRLVWLLLFQVQKSMVTMT